MTQNDKDLLIRDLCARLPYGVKVEYENEIFDVEYVCPMYEEVKLDIPETWTIDVSEVKPYLFPLSSMTEEQKKDIFHNGKFYIDRRNSLCRFPMYEDDYDFVTMEDCLEIFNKLNRYHFDYRGLIPMGMAIDATGKNIY